MLVQQLQSLWGRRDINLCHKMQLLHLFAECTSKKKEGEGTVKWNGSHSRWMGNKQWNWVESVSSYPPKCPGNKFSRISHNTTFVVAADMMQCKVHSMTSIRTRRIRSTKRQRRRTEKIVKSHTDGKQKRSSVIKMIKTNTTKCNNREMNEFHRFCCCFCRSSSFKFNDEFPWTFYTLSWIHTFLSLPAQERQRPRAI